MVLFTSSLFWFDLLLEFLFVCINRWKSLHLIIASLIQFEVLSNGCGCSSFSVLIWFDLQLVELAVWLSCIFFGNRFSINSKVFTWVKKYSRMVVIGGNGLKWTETHLFGFFLQITWPAIIWRQQVLFCNHVGLAVWNVILQSLLVIPGYPFITFYISTLTSINIICLTMCFSSCL